VRRCLCDRLYSPCAHAGPPFVRRPSAIDMMIPPGIIVNLIKVRRCAICPDSECDQISTTYLAISLSRDCLHACIDFRAFLDVGSWRDPAPVRPSSFRAPFGCLWTRSDSQAPWGLGDAEADTSLGMLYLSQRAHRSLYPRYHEPMIAFQLGFHAFSV
jgi:hypothetical protein